jgi:hypothetical protein
LQVGRHKQARQGNRNKPENNATQQRLNHD